MLEMRREREKDAVPVSIFVAVRLYEIDLSFAITHHAAGQ